MQKLKPKLQLPTQAEVMNTANFRWPVHSYEYAGHLETIVTYIVSVGALLFIYGRNLARVDMRAGIDAHPSKTEAQGGLDIVLFEGPAACGE